MKYDVFIAEDARRDIRMAHSWYSEQSVKLAGSFLKALNSIIKRIGKIPYQTQIRYGNIRIAFLKRYPFGIHFKVTENVIIILAVFHTSQNPKDWPE